METVLSQWPPGSRRRVLDLGAPVHVTEYGAPEAEEVVLCLHGLGGSALNFGLVGPTLARGRRVLVPDLPGHGASPAARGEGGALETDLRTISRLLASEAGLPVVLVGHSMGGILAALLASRSPELVSRLVLLDPPVPNVTRWGRDPRLSAKLAFLRLPGVAALVERQVLGMSPEQLVARQLADATPHVERVPTEVVDATVAEVRATRARGGAGPAQRAQFQAILDVVALLARPAQWRRQLARISAPTLWLQGEDDPLAEVRAARALAATRPGWTFAVRPGVGHLPHLEDPTWTAATIEDWLQDHR